MNFSRVPLLRRPLLAWRAKIFFSVTFQVGQPQIVVLSSVRPPRFLLRGTSPVQMKRRRNFNTWADKGSTLVGFSFDDDVRYANTTVLSFPISSVHLGGVTVSASPKLPSRPLTPSPSPRVEHRIITRVQKKSILRRTRSIVLLIGSSSSFSPPSRQVVRSLLDRSLLRTARHEPSRRPLRIHVGREATAL